jgi:hypothetical protein
VDGACASFVFLVRLKNSDTVNLRWVFQRTYGRRSLRGGSSLRTAVGIYTVFYNSNGNFVGGGINIYV